MDLSDPTRALTPTLDGPVLAVLARAGRPLTVGDIAQQAARGSEIGIRRSVARLVDQGIVTATQMGRNLVHELNRDHLAAPAATVLADLRLELWKRLRETLSGWAEKPVHAAVFGSAARGDGGPDSDIDLLLVHQPFPGDETPQVKTPGWVTLVGALAAAATGSSASYSSSLPDTKAWHASVDALHRSVQRWTGNSLHAVELSTWQWFKLSTSDPVLDKDIRHHGIVVAGSPNLLTVPALA
ncbi:MAG: nucleotidyltransferase domain-containing protein [Acidimicrobiales bacterium]